MNKRIWELDTLRGVLMLAIMAYHLFYDLVFLFSLVELSNPFLRGLYEFCNDWLGLPFLFLSGLCITLGSHPVRRGLQVLGGGMIITAVTAGMYLLGFADKSIIIYFGVLHCLGCCMLLWPLFKKLPAPVLLPLGIALLAVGLCIKSKTLVDFPWLVPLGFTPASFASSDFFPLLPNLGYFLIGTFLGRTLYKHKQSLFPGACASCPPIRFLSFIGRHSLLLYLLHQPVLAGAVALWATIFQEVSL